MPVSIDSKRPPILGILVVAFLSSCASSMEGKRPESAPPVAICQGPTVSELILDLKDSDRIKRLRAMVKLRCFGPKAKEAVPALVAALKQPSGVVGIQLIERGPEKMVGDGIIRVVPGSAADRAGIRAHDELLAVDGVAVVSLPQSEVVARIRGEIGSAVKLTIWKRDGTLWNPTDNPPTPGSTVTVSLRRAAIGDPFLISEALSTLGSIGPQAASAASDVRRLILYLAEGELAAKAIECLEKILPDGQENLNLYMSVLEQHYRPGPVYILNRAARNSVRAKKFLFEFLLSQGGAQAQELLGILRNFSAPGIEEFNYLRRAMDAPDPAVRAIAINWIGLIHPTEAGLISIVLPRFEDRNGAVREASYAVLGKLTPQDAASVPELLHAFEQFPNHQSLISSALRNIGKPREADISAVVEALKSPNANAAEFAARFLGRLGPGRKELLPALNDAFKRPESSVAEEAAMSLAEVGPDAIPLLMNAVGDRRRGIYFRDRLIRLALQKIGPPGAPALAEALAGLDGTDLSNYFYLLKTISPEIAESTPVLHLMFLESPYSGFLDSTAFKNRDDRAFRLIVDGLKNPRPEIRHRAEEFVGQFGSSPDDLRGLLRREEAPAVREALERAILRLEGSKSPGSPNPR